MATKEVKFNKIDRKKLIQSYGFAEKLASNKDFLQESLELATRISGAEVAYISLLDDKHQYILSQYGTKFKTIDVRDSICQYTIKSDTILVIENTRENELTACLPQVNEEDGITFYAGCPLTNREGIKIGALCVMDKKNKSLSKTQKDTLVILAKQIINTLDNQRNLIKLIKKINTNFKPAACSDLNCLQGELDHLQDEVVAHNKLIKDQKLALENANGELVNFAYMVAHDVRAPLRTINSFIALHEKDLQNVSANTYRKEYLSFIKQGVTNLDEFTKDLLAYARADNNAISDEKLSLNQMLNTALFHLTEMINRTNAEIVLPTSNFFIHGKKLQMIQLFQNLISNGVKYQSGETLPRVVVQAKEKGEKITISIIDNGIGISQDNLKKIFEPFKRLHASSRYSGTGIGLATCKKIIDELDAEFVVSSELGKGTTFSFDLPKYKHK